MNKRGILTVISGFSGAGKGTIVKKMIEKYDYELSISATSRKPREHEQHGREYFFLTREQFRCMIENEQLIEWTEYVGNYYGTPREYVENQLALGKDVILEIEIEGAFHVKELFENALLLFITPPTAKELKQRLLLRGTEKDDVIQQRLLRAYEEADYMNQYDYIVVNDKLEECVETVHNLIQNQKLKVMYQNDLLKEMKTQLEAFKEGE